MTSPAIPLRTAVAGVGYLGRFHAQKYATLEGSRLVGVVDASLETAQKVGAELGVPGFQDHRQVLGQVDAISIAVPTPLHHRVASEFLQHGVHVLVEKPITTTVAEAAELVALARAKGLVL